MTKILIIEDDPILSRMYEKKLLDEGYKVYFAFDGRVGKTLIRTEKPDLVLLDIMLSGGMNGFDILQGLREDKITKNLPVLILTNLDSEAKTAEQLGASGYLIKANTRPDMLVTTVKNLLLNK